MSSQILTFSEKLMESTRSQSAPPQAQPTSPQARPTPLQVQVAPPKAQPTSPQAQAALPQMIVANNPIILPLSMPSGKPYWYTVSEKMAWDSSQLRVDPFPSPSAIAQEAYYSSALDGAVGFSNRVRQALLFALQRLQTPICAELVNDVAKLLSGIATPYRTSTTPGTPQPATIPWHMDQLYRFLDDERYHPLIRASTSHAFILAVQPFSPDFGGGHGANGRLARLISMMVLLRSGYSFLLNSSQSAIIVDRNQEYAQAFQRIFLPNNAYGHAGDVTGFVEFVLEVLAAAQQQVSQERSESIVKSSNDGYRSTADSHSAADSHHSSEIPRIDRQATSITDKSDDVTVSVNDTPPVGTAAPVMNQSDSVLEPAFGEIDEITEKRTENDVEPVLRRIDSATIVALPFENRLSILETSPTPLVRQTATIIRGMLRDQQFEFTKRSWCEKNGMSLKQFNAVRFTLYRYKLVFIARKTGLKAVYRFTLNSDSECVADDKEDDQTALQIEETGVDMLHDTDVHSEVNVQLDADEQTEPDRQTEPDSQAEIAEMPEVDGQLNTDTTVEEDVQSDSATQLDLPVLREMDASRFESVRETAVFYRGLLNDNITEITSAEWIKRSGQTAREFHKSYEILKKRHLITNPNKNQRQPILYRITPECNAFLPPDVFWSRIESLESSKSENIRRGAATVRKMVEEGLSGFTSQVWAERTGMLIIEFGSIRNRLFENQLITNENKGSSVRDAYYRFMLEGHPGNVSSEPVSSEPAVNSLTVAPPSDKENQIQRFILHLNEMNISKSEIVRRCADIIRAMIVKGVMFFSSEDWMQWSNMNRQEYSTCSSAMLSRGMIRRLPKVKKKKTDYAFNWPVGEVLPDVPIPTIQEKRIVNTNYTSILKQLAGIVPIDRFPEKVMAAMIGSTHHTTEHDWAAANNMSLEEASRDLNILCCMGIVTRRFFKKTDAFSYHFKNPDVLLRMLQNGEILSPPKTDNLFFWANVALISKMKSSITRKAAEIIYRMVEEGVFYFTYGSWIRRGKMNQNQFRGCMTVLMSQHVVTLVESSVNPLLFRLNIVPPETPIDFCELIGIEKAISEAQVKRIKEFSANAFSEIDKRIASFLLVQVEKGICYFTKKDYVKAYPLSQTSKSKDILRATCLGLVGRTYALGTTVYILSPVVGDKSGAGRELPFSSRIPESSSRSEKKRKTKHSDTLSRLHKKRLTTILHTFGYKEFTRIDYENTFHLLDGRFALDTMIAAGVIVKKKASIKNYYRLAVTPEERPECFDMSLGSKF